MKTYALATLGCKVNQYESGLIAERLAGIENVPFGVPADLYVINTCGVTSEASAKTRQLIARARKAAPNAMLVLAGCWLPAEKERLKTLGVDLFLDNNDKANIAEHLRLNGMHEKTRPVKTQKRTRAFIKVQDGCNARCSYCAVPLFRSKLASKPIYEIAEEVRRLTAAGVPEIVLTGIHLGKYGVDFKQPQPKLTNLVEYLLAETAIPRLRLSSIEPQEITDNLIEHVARETRLAKHFHIPLQSGSDKILASMNRRYRIADYLTLVKKIRRHSPRAGLTTDIIVGFPGETDEDFQATIKAVQSLRISRLHVFKFSGRPNTAAAGFPDQVDPAVKKERAAVAKKLDRRLASEFAAGFVDREVSVVIEQHRENTGFGLTSEYVRVKFEQAVKNTGSIVKAFGIKSEENVLIVEE